MDDFRNKFFDTTPLIGEALKLTGPECLEEICRVIKVEFGARTALIGSLGIVEAEHFFTEAFSSDIEGFHAPEFSAHTSACRAVLESKDFVAIPKDVVEQFPDAPILSKLKSNAYVGCPLINERGNCMGVLSLEWPKAISPALVSEIKTILGPFLPRITEELLRIMKAHVVETMISPVSPQAIEGSEVYRMIVKQAAELSGVHTVVLAKNCNEDRGNFRILAVHSDRHPLHSVEGESLGYIGTPCQNLLNQDLFFQERNLRETFADVKFLRDVDAESYLGVGFCDSKGETIGHIAFVHNRPMADRVVRCQLLKMITSRAGLELQRYELELERNAMEAALRVRSKLESLGIMAGTIAHDFNNQLAAMIGNTELALLETPPEHPTQEYLKAAEESMWRARDVIGELMDFAGNTTSSDFESIALGEIVASTLRDFGPQLSDGSTIHSNIEDGLPNVMGRRMHLIQIVSNLIANGLDAKKHGQRADIQIKAGWINPASVGHLKCLTGLCDDFPERCIFLEVSDAGRGMDSQTAERIFDPYFSTKGVSRGLGLSSVLGLAKRLGIGLTFESKPQKGTMFRLYFKTLDENASTSDEQTPNGRENTDNRSSRKTVLVVDDEKSVQNMVCKLIGTMGHDIHRASSGEEALEAMRKLPSLDLAIVDVVMPGINGFETITELRKLNRRLPAILMSGFSERNLSDSFTQDETTKFLVKPFSIQSVRSTIADLVT